MAKRNGKTVLFLCTGNYYRSRFAEILFNSVASKMGLAWSATSRALALERGLGNVGSMSPLAITALEKLDLADFEAQARFPIQASADDFDHADLIVALKEIEHRPLVQDRFASAAGRVEYWHVDDAPGVLGLVEREVMNLMARILGGGAEPTAAPTLPGLKKATTQAAKSMTAKVGRETKGRRGKGVTTVSEVPLDDAGLRELAARLKAKCGTGGTVKEGRIEIQGDQRERVVEVLNEMGFRVKRAGG